jgi:hypothetical protein
MTSLAQQLAFVTCLLVGGGGQVACPEDISTPHPSPTPFLAPRSEALRSPVGLPSEPQPFLVCLGENGLDEEEENEPDTPLALAPSCGQPGRPRDGIVSGSSAPGRSLPGRFLSPLVLRC